MHGTRRYSIENYNGSARTNIDVAVSAYDLANTYEPAWEMLVKKGKALGVMCSCTSCIHTNLKGLDLPRKRY